MHLQNEYNSNTDDKKMWIFTRVTLPPLVIIDISSI